jgi:hypothetical protein
MTTATQSSYGTSSAASGARSDAVTAGTGTTHYAYRLERDEEGKVTGKEFINNLQIFENESQYGKYLKMRVTGPIPNDDLFIVRKRDKSVSA